MLRFRNYWIYSAGLAIAWAVVLILARTIRGKRERADHPVGLFRLLYRLGVDDDCPIRLSAAKALGVEPPPGVIPSIDPPCGPLANDTQRAARVTSVVFLSKSWPKGSLPLLSDRKPPLAARTALQTGSTVRTGNPEGVSNCESYCRTYQ